MPDKSIFNSFTNSYQLSKTLRFELIPIGKTLGHIENKGLLQADANRAASYQKMKKTIDEYHKYFIEFALKGARLTKLDEYATLFAQRKEESCSR